MEKVRPRCGQPSDRGQLKNRTEHGLVYSETESEAKASSWKTETSRLYHLRLQQQRLPRQQHPDQCRIQPSSPGRQQQQQQQRAAVKSCVNPARNLWLKKQ